MADNEKPSLHIDSDWKAQAQAEKQKLTEASAEAGAQGDQAGQEGRMPPANFRTLISTMVTQALYAMGAIPDPQTGQRVAILDLARHHIDMLGVIEEKTKGNLDEEESKMLSTTLHELRMQYMQLSQQALQQQQGQGQAGGQDPGQTGGLGQPPNPQG
jgi:hypothetical protein